MKPCSKIRKKHRKQIMLINMSAIIMREHLIKVATI